MIVLTPITLFISTKTYTDYKYIYKTQVDIWKTRMMYVSVSATGILGKRKSESSYQESNQRPFDY